MFWFKKKDKKRAMVSTIIPLDGPVGTPPPREERDKPEVPPLKCKTCGSKL